MTTATRMKRTIEDIPMCETCGDRLDLGSKSWRAMLADWRCEACKRYEAEMVTGVKRRKPMFEMTEEDALLHIPFTGQNALCGRCANLFKPAERTYWPAELDAAVCEPCLERCKGDLYQFHEDMAEWARLQDEGQLDEDHRAPSRPMTTIPF